MTAALEGGEWSAARPGRTLPSGRTRYPFYRRLGGPQGRSERKEKLPPPRDSTPYRPARSQSLYRLSYWACLITCTCHKVHEINSNWELNDFYSFPYIIRVIKSRRMRWVGQVARLGDRKGTYRVLVGTPL